MMTKKLLLLFCCLVWISSVNAQYDGTNILTFLSAVPDNLENRESLISYVDYRAMEAAREGAATYQTWDEFMDSEEMIEEGLFMAALTGISSGPDFVSRMFGGGELWEETVGFDFFDIDRALSFGTLPTHADVLGGEFDTEAIATAFTARDFTSESLGEFDLWCSADGCDKGVEIDVQNRNAGNPFGGDLGRRQPLLVSENLLISSSAFPVLILAEDAVSDNVDSLADNPTYIAAVNSINPDNIIIQATFVYFTQIVPNIGLDITDTDVDIAVLEQQMSELRDMPQYEMLMFADTATDTEQVAYVTLVYFALEDAESAVEIVPERFATMDSYSIGRPIHEIFEERGVNEIVSTAVMDEENDRALAVFEFHADLASSDEEDLGPLGFPSSSMVYRLMVNMLFQRDTDWLVAGIGDS